jgi:DNA adenine methylase
MDSTIKQVVKPFLKYPGNKFRLGEKIWQFMQMHGITACDRFIEPFCGTGGLSLYLQDKLKCSQYYWSDSDPYLIETLSYAITEPEDTIKVCEEYFKDQSKNAYLNVREHFNWLIHEADFLEEYNQAEVAACFIYLNKLGFKSLVGFNKAGHFNVPYGDGKKAVIPYKAIREFSTLAKTSISVEFNDYQSIFSKLPMKGSVFYIDPPQYSSKPSTVIKHFGGAWSANEHKRLIEYCFALKEKGAKVLYSNNNEEFIINLLSGASDIVYLDAYKGFHIVGELKPKEILAYL